MDENTSPELFKVRILITQVLMQKELLYIDSFFEKADQEDLVFKIDSDNTREAVNKEKESLKAMEEICTKTKEILKNRIDDGKIHQSQNDVEDELKASRALFEWVQRLNHMIYNKKFLSFEQAVKPELQLDCDSYLFTSKIIDFVIVIMVCCLLFAPLSFVYFFMNLFCCFPENRGKSNWEILRINLSLVLLLLFSIVLILPGTLVVATVASCLISLREEYYDVSSELDGGIITVMHVLFIVFYFFLSMKEVSSSVKTMAYFFKVIGENWKEQSLEEKNGAMKTKDNPKSWACLNFLRKSIIAFLSFLRIIPQFVQIAFCFWLCYINIILIYQISDTNELIQNFAALAILLEFDNLIMSFLRSIRFKLIYDFIFIRLMGFIDEERFSVPKEEKKAEPKIAKEEESSENEEVFQNFAMTLDMSELGEFALIPEYGPSPKKPKNLTNKKTGKIVDPEEIKKQIERQKQLEMEKKAEVIGQGIRKQISKQESMALNDIQRQELKDKEYKLRAQSLFEAAFSKNWREESIESIINAESKIKILNGKVSEKLNNCEEKDFLTDLVNLNLVNLTISIPRFLSTYFKSRNRDIEILMSEGSFPISQKYQLREEEETSEVQNKEENLENKKKKKKMTTKNVADTIAFGIILFGIVCVVLAYIYL